MLVDHNPSHPFLPTVMIPPADSSDDDVNVTDVQKHLDSAMDLDHGDASTLWPAHHNSNGHQFHGNHMTSAMATEGGLFHHVLSVGRDDRNRPQGLPSDGGIFSSNNHEQHRKKKKKQKGKITLAMGYRADCEKCQLKVPGHYSHFIDS